MGSVLLTCFPRTCVFFFFVSFFPRTCVFFPFFVSFLGPVSFFPFFVSFLGPVSFFFLSFFFFFLLCFLHRTDVFFCVSFLVCFFLSIFLFFYFFILLFNMGTFAECGSFNCAVYMLTFPSCIICSLLSGKNKTLFYSRSSSPHLCFA